MRVFTENGVEKIASTFRLPKSAIITLNASNGTEDRFVKTNNKGQGSMDNILSQPYTISVVSSQCPVNPER